MVKTDEALLLRLKAEAEDAPASFEKGVVFSLFKQWQRVVSEQKERAQRPTGPSLG